MGGVFRKHEKIRNVDTIFVRKCTMKNKNCIYMKVADARECGNELSGSAKCGEFLD